MNTPQPTMTAADLVATYGRLVPLKEVAAFFGLAEGTVRKYAHRLGGIEVIPGVWRFYESRIANEVMNGQPVLKARDFALARVRDGRGEDTSQVVPRRIQKIRARGNPVGGEDPERAPTGGEGQADTNRHGLAHPFVLAEHASGQSAKDAR